MAPRDIEHKTPLHCAASLGQAGVARVLLDAGAEVDAKDATSATPLHMGAADGDEGVGIVRILLDAGADEGAKDDTGASLIRNTTTLSTLQ